MNLKTKLAECVSLHIKAKGWTGKEAAEFGKVAPTRISKIMNMRLEGFSSDALMKLLEEYGFVLTGGAVGNEYQLEMHIPENQAHQG
jgi:predicted XRE-type DNA-binding protein